MCLHTGYVVMCTYDTRFLRSFLFKMPKVQQVDPEVLSPLWSKDGCQVYSAYSRAQYEAMSLVAVEYNFELLKDVFETFPGPPASRSTISKAISLADPSGAADQMAWQTDNFHEIWKFVWRCFRRAPLGSNSTNMGKLKKMLRNAYPDHIRQFRERGHAPDGIGDDGEDDGNGEKEEEEEAEEEEGEMKEADRRRQ